MSNWMRRLCEKICGAAIAFAICGYVLIGPAAAQAPAGCYPLPAPVPASAVASFNLDWVKKALVYYRCSQYDADIAAVLAGAKTWVAMRAPQVPNPAIILDIDETSLSNWTRIYRDDFAYIENGGCDLDKRGEACGDKAWQASEQAPAVGPTLELYNLARCNAAPPSCQKVEVFFVTGRHVDDKTINGKTPTEWTLGNLDKAGYKGVSPDHLYMRPADSSGPVAPYKTNARVDIERRFNVTIIANVGDQESDLAGGHAERTFKLPNPFYYIP
jgi:predicted secreted acid phosphatase